MQMFAVRANLLLGQKKGVVVPTQAGYQSCPFRAVKSAEITLQVIACVASRTATGEAQAHVYQRPKHVLAEVASHGACRNVPAFFGAVWIVELDQQTPVLALVITRPGEDSQRRTHRTRLAVVTGIKHAFGRQAKASRH